MVKMENNKKLEVRNEKELQEVLRWFEQRFPKASLEDALQFVRVVLKK
jgi:hypothetical protein